MKSIKEETVWANFLSPQFRYTCDDCLNQLEEIPPPFCKHCKKQASPNHQKCDDCKRWANHFGEDPLDQNISIFTYNEFMKEMMARFKYRGDYEAVYSFREPLNKAYTTHFAKKHYTLVPIPLSDDRYETRKFNQAEALASLLKKPIHTQLLKREDTTKQAKRTRTERVLSKNPFHLTNHPPEKILLIDDIYTTGTTLRQVASLLKNAGVKNVKALTLIRS
ncbi:ComF family protein [Alkalibacillus silvisoli]|uniref:ComF family protein n=1 Tax=Alkalibacillus silvisoli TaxID=392823 RepID=UPI0031CEFC49